VSCIVLYRVEPLGGQRSKDDANRWI
jgi:hypothetical protein